MGYCKVCLSDRRPEIDKAIRAGATLVSLVERFPGVASRDTFRRHREHMPKLEAPPPKIREMALDTIEDLIAAVKIYIEWLHAIADEAQTKGNSRLVLDSVKGVKSVLELAAKLRGFLNEGSQVNVTLVANPDWHRVRDTIVEALGPYPEALDAVVNALESRKALPAPDAEFTEVSDA